MRSFTAHRKPVSRIAFSPDGLLLATGAREPSLKVFSLDTGRELWSASSFPSYYGTFDLAFSFDGRWLATAEHSGVHVRNSVTGMEVAVLAKPEPANRSSWHAVAFLPNEGVLLTGGSVGQDYKCLLGWWHTQEWSQRKQWQEKDGGGYIRIAVSATGKFAAIMHYGALQVWDLPNWQLIWKADIRVSHGVTSLAFSPDETALAYSAGCDVRVCATKSGEQMTILCPSKKHIQAAVFSPDGRSLVTISNDSVAIVWDTAGWYQRNAFAWEIGQLRSAAFSPDSCLIAAGSDRGKVVLWDFDD